MSKGTNFKYFKTYQVIMDFMRGIQNMTGYSERHNNKGLITGISRSYEEKHWVAALRFIISYVINFLRIFTK